MIEIPLTTQAELDDRLTSSILESDVGFKYAFYWDAVEVYSYEARTLRVLRVLYVEVHKHRVIEVIRKILLKEIRELLQ